MKSKDIKSQAKKLASKLIVGAMLGGVGFGLAGCVAMPQQKSSNSGSSASAQNMTAHFSDKSGSIQQQIINSEELSYLKSRGNLLAIQADKHIQHINSTQHQRYPIPYTRSSDGNYWSWFTDHYVPKSVIKEVLMSNRSDASDTNISDSDQQMAYNSKEFDNEIQKNLAKHNVNYGINYAILGNSASNALDVYDTVSDQSDMPMKYYSTDTKLQQWANTKEKNYLQDIGNAKAKEADQKVEQLNKKHHQKYPIPYTKSDDGNYWSWYQKHSIPQSVIDKFYSIEKGHDSDYGLSSDSGYITHRFDNDVQFTLMKHNVNYGVNYSRLSSKISNKYSNWEHASD